MDITPPRLFPMCIVWVPIPFVTWLLPFVGHLGIGRADGTILDFLGPYHVQVGNFGFGHPVRYWKIDPTQSSAYRPSDDKSVEEWWDEELEHSAMFFRTLFYNFCGTNCHSFVAFFLNQIDYRSSTQWNSVLLACILFFRGRYVSTIAVLKAWVPFGIVMSVCLYLGRLTFVYVYLAVAVLVVAYFAMYEYLFRAQWRLIDQYRYNRPDHSTLSRNV